MINKMEKKKQYEKKEKKIYFNISNVHIQWYIQRIRNYSLDIVHY